MKKILFILSFLCTAFMINAQVLSVSGVVTDASTGAPASGVQIIISNPTLGGSQPVGWSITDANGSYYWLDTIGAFPVMGVGVLDVSMIDCNGNQVNQSITYTPNTISLTANFTFCSGGNGNCFVSLSPASVNGNSVSLSANLSGAGATGVTYYWNMGDGTNYTTQVVNHTYAAAGTYSICVLATGNSGCVDTSCVSVTIAGSGGGNCSAFMTYLPDSTNPMVNYFTVAASGGTAPYTYMWDFGDGNVSTTQSPTHTYIQNGTYITCVTVTDATGCIITDCQPVHVTTNVPCVTSFTSSTSPANPNNYMFTSINANSSSTLYLWDFGDGTVDTISGGIATHTYTQAGTYLACLLELDFVTGCTSTYCDTVIVAGGSACQAFITYSNIPGSLTVDFFGSVTSNNNPVTYAWDFGDGNTSTVQNPTHTYQTLATGPVSYNVTLTTTDASGCIAVATETVFVFGGNVTGSIIGYMWKDTLNLTPADGLVYLIEYDSITGTLTAIDTVTTQQGFFDFQNVPMGLYLVKGALLPSDPDYANYLPTYFIQSLNWANAQYVGPVFWGLPALIDIQLVAGNNNGGPGFIGGLVVNGAGRPVTGDVTLIEDILDEEPMEGISVLLLDANNNAVTHTVTAADGSYSFNNLAEGTYNVHVEEVGKVTFPATVTIDANNLNHAGVHFTVHENMVTLTGAYAVTNVEDFQVFPNPVHNTANVQLDLKESMNLTMTVTNLMGQEFMNQPLNLNAGDNSFQIEMSDLPTGLYLVSLKSETDVITYKIQKL